MPNLPRSGAAKRPVRVVAPIKVNGLRLNLIVLAYGPLSITKSIWKLSIAGYKNSSTTFDRRCISSIKRISPASKLVRMPIKSPARSIAGPLVAVIFAAIS